MNVRFFRSAFALGLLTISDAALALDQHLPPYERWTVFRVSFDWESPRLSLS
jgi:hypothetical protein